MSVAAETNVTPRLTFNWRLEVEGVPAAYVSAVQIPKVETAVVIHSSGGAVHDTKTAGKLKYGDITIEKAMTATGGDRWAWDYLREARNNNGTGNPLTAKKAVTLSHLADDGDVVIDAWEITGAWVGGIEYSKNDALQEGERMVETCTLHCDKYERA